MNTWTKVLRYEMRNVLRARALLGYGLFFLAATTGLVRMGGGVERVLPSLSNLILLTVPLVSLVVTTVFLYEGRAFNELLLSQPVGRKELFRGLFMGLTLPLAGVFVVGTGLPLLASGGFSTAAGPVALTLGSGIALTAVFVALGFLVAFSVKEAARGLGVALLVWLGLTVVYDGVVLLASHNLSAYPLETPMLAAMILNPVDLARMVSLMAVDASVLMGYTGAVFQDFFGGWTGIVIATAALAGWVLLPYLGALRRFGRMDL
ncbi:MAG: ABC transporter permease [Gemmatimonadales bacterium]|nr:MAG: ABC transporter permease [Gemmatimonadales bacterium]